MDKSVASVRRFNRLYTRHMGLLHEKLVRSPFSLAEARVMYEVAHHDGITATELSQALELDRGYLSRLLQSLEQRGLLKKRPSPRDARQNLLSLSAKGRKAFDGLQRDQNEDVARVLESIAPADRPRLVHAMQTIADVLEPSPPSRSAVVIRPIKTGEMSWIVHRHAVLYQAEYGWDERFEGLVMEIGARFLAHHDARRECCWVAEVEGDLVGSVMICQESAEVARLRLLLVEPRARGLGLGRRLVDECIRFSRRAGYSMLTLWTNDVLDAARHIYEQAGFNRVHSVPHDKFGEGLVGETWDLMLNEATVT